jgi:hypothetical protein
VCPLSDRLPELVAPGTEHPGVPGGRRRAGPAPRAAGLARREAAAGPAYPESGADV